MKVSVFLAPLALGLGLSTSVAMAQELVIPDRQRLQAMSHEEYDAYREQMRSRMEEQSPAEQNLMRESGVNGREQMEKRNNGYGQGYGSRNGHDSRTGGGPGIGSGSMQGGGQGGYGRGGGRRR